MEKKNQKCLSDLYYLFINLQWPRILYWQWLVPVDWNILESPGGLPSRLHGDSVTHCSQTSPMCLPLGQRDVGVPRQTPQGDYEFAPLRCSTLYTVDPDEGRYFSFSYCWASIFLFFKNFLLCSQIIIRIIIIIKINNS